MAQYFKFKECVKEGKTSILDHIANGSSGIGDNPLNRYQSRLIVCARHIYVVSEGLRVDGCGRRCFVRLSRRNTKEDDKCRETYTT